MRNIGKNFTQKKLIIPYSYMRNNPYYNYHKWYIKHKNAQFVNKTPKKSIFHFLDFNFLIPHQLTAEQFIYKKSHSLQL